MFLKTLQNFANFALLLEPVFDKVTVSRPKTSLKRDSSTGIFMWILCSFSKNIIYRISLDNCFCRFRCSNQFFFSFDNCNYGSLFRKGIKIFFFYFLWWFIQKLTWMLSRQFRLGSNLEKIQKSQQLPSAEANFEDC